MKDPIVEEIHRWRRERAERFHHDIDAMFEDLRRKEEESKARGAIFVTPKLRKAPTRSKTPARKTLAKAGT